MKEIPRIASWRAASTCGATASARRESRNRARSMLSECTRALSATADRGASCCCCAAFAPPSGALPRAMASSVPTACSRFGRRSPSRGSEANRAYERSSGMLLLLERSIRNFYKVRVYYGHLNYKELHVLYEYIPEHNKEGLRFGELVTV